MGISISRNKAPLIITKTGTPHLTIRSIELKTNQSKPLTSIKLQFDDAMRSIITEKVANTLK